jgi:heat shock protein HtpX
LERQLGCMVAGVLVLLVVLVVLLATYWSAAGQLPFTFRNGPFGIPPWLPMLVLLAATLGVVVVPAVLRRRGPREPTFRDQIAANNRNCAFLTLALVGGMATTAYTLFTVVSLRTTVGLAAAAVTVVMGIVGAVASYGYGDRMILTISRARAIDPSSEPVLRDVVNEMAIAAGIPVPKLYLIDESAPNALATGRDPAHASIAVTQGLLDQLDRAELQGVIAHELAHVRNGDTRYDQFVAILAGTIAFVADGFFRVVTFPYWIGKAVVDHQATVEQAPAAGIHGGGSSGSWHFSGGSGGGGSFGGGGNGKGAGGLILFILAIAIFAIMVLIVVWVIRTLAPLFARIVQAAVNREREFLADASAVEMTRNPRGLEDALLKVASSKEVLQVANRATVPLYFTDPIRASEKRASRIFSTHPPTADRIDRLRALEGRSPLDDAARESIAEAID